MHTKQLEKTDSIIHVMYYQAIEMMIAQYQPKDKLIGQWNSIESPETDPHVYGNLPWGKSRHDNSLGKVLVNKWNWGK